MWHRSRGYPSPQDGEGVKKYYSPSVATITALMVCIRFSA